MAGDNAPRITINSPEFQKAFDAFSDYLDGQDFLTRKNLILHVSGAKGIDVQLGSDGTGITVEQIPEDFEQIRIWQLLRVNDKLYVEPGMVHLKSEEDSAEYAYLEPCLNGKSIYDDPRPYWDLPLEVDTLYYVYLVVDPCLDECRAFLLLLKEGEDPSGYVTDTENSHIFTVHGFTTSSGGSYGDEGQYTDPGGYPELLYNSQKLSSEPTICCEPLPCDSKGSSSLSESSGSESSGSSSSSSESSESESESESASESASESVEESESESVSVEESESYEESESIGESSQVDSSEECLEVVTGLSCIVVDDNGRCCLDLTVEYTEICGVEVKGTRDEDLNCCE